MDQTISFTASELFSFITTISGWLIAINAGILVIITWYKKLRKPQDTQNERLANLEERMNSCEENYRKLQDDLAEASKELNEIDQDNRAFQRIIVKSLQALSEHAIDGNNVEQLKNTVNELNDYLLAKV